jgi:hypothetical protein
MQEAGGTRKSTTATLADWIRRAHSYAQQGGLRGVMQALRRRWNQGLRGLMRRWRTRGSTPPSNALDHFAGRATTFKLEETLLFTSQPHPWRSLARADAEINPIPSMMHADEARHLYWLAAHQYRGDGKIVDLGPLAGGSAHALAAGLADNPHVDRPRRQIHSCDYWEFTEDIYPYFPGHTLRPGQNLQPLFEANLGSLLPFVAPHKGDLCSCPWRGGAIEILFVDAAKTPETMSYIARHLFPQLIPGHSVVVHQDYVSATCPWIHLAMEYLRDSWEPVDSPEGGSVCFVPVRPLSANALPEGFFETLSIRDGRHLLRGARANLRGWYKLCVWLAEAYYLTIMGEHGLAEAIVQQVQAHPDYCDSVRYDVDFVRRHLASGVA